MSEEEEMEKRGVVCDCANHPDGCTAVCGEIVKTGSGNVCKHCGRPVNSSQEKYVDDKSSDKFTLDKPN